MEICNYEGEAIWYVPDYQDNRDKPKDKQFAVLLVPASRAELRRLEERRGAIGRGGKYNPVKRYNKSRDDVLKKCVREVENVTEKKVRGGKVERIPITTGPEFVRIAPNLLAEDVVTALEDQSQLEEGMREKSDSQSDSFI